MSTEVDLRKVREVAGVKSTTGRVTPRPMPHNLLHVGDRVRIIGYRGKPSTLDGREAVVARIKNELDRDTVVRDYTTSGPYWTYFDLEVIEPVEVQPPAAPIKLSVEESWNLRPYGQMTTKELRALAKGARGELHARYIAHKTRQVEQISGYVGLANFMAGVTWALACRALLRWSKGHAPVGGKTPQHGAMWLPWELMDASRKLEIRVSAPDSGGGGVGRPGAPNQRNPLKRRSPYQYPQYLKSLAEDLAAPAPE